ncbi:MAG: helix-turn-helix domain-containing protein [Roseburia inulinivorans]|nr:helix-turn-helix domain-containing protein [Roseburia inulinivorans]
MSFGTRLKARREQLGITQPQLAEMLGVSKGAIGNYETDANSPKATILFKVFDVLKCDANYLFQDEMGNNYPMKVSYDEYESIKKYRNLDDHGKELVNYTLDKETERIEKYGKLGEVSRPVTAFPMRLISYYFKNASAGTGQLVIDNLPDKDIEIPDKPEYRNVSYAIGVNGSSMEPAFQDGDILLVEATQEIEVGDVGIFQINNECFVKKLGEKELISLNKDYKNIPLDETAATLGKVIGKL